MTEHSRGTIVTFYSFKGGTGRTMALANTAWILASAGYRVLVVDWDLESPGLHRFFEPFLDADTIERNSGVIDMIKDYQWEVTRNPDAARSEEKLRRHARVGPHVVPLDWEFPPGGALDIVSAGRQNRNYSANVASLDWDNFYDRLGGGQFFDAMREDMRSEYDYTLIDSRTGFSDVSAICTVDLPDVLVTCFTLSNQAVVGAADLAAEIASRASTNRRIRILPVPSRIDEGEKEKADIGRQWARARFASLPASMSADELTEYWGSVEIPYRPFYAYEEILAAFGDAPGVANSLLSAFERLVAYITEGAVTSYAPVPEVDRMRVLAAFTRKQVSQPAAVVISFVPRERMWAEWIEGTLESVGVRVRRFGADTDPESLDSDRILVVGSAAYVQSATYRALTEGVSADFPAGAENRLAVANVADSRLGGHFATTRIVDLNGLSETQAVEALLRVVELPATTVWPGSGRAGPRFPGNSPSLFVVPQRNPSFTGRDTALDELRELFAASAASDLRRVALHGLGGVGKTQVALEYAYRFQADYDLVWWVDAEQDETVIGSLAELAARLGIAVGDSSRAAAEDAVQTLRRRGSEFRWLLVFDNADEPGVLERFLPPGATGHTLVTSRNKDWAAIAEPLEVNVFDRAESVELLTHRVDGLGSEDANRVASALGDLPLAVEVAAAWLSVTGSPVQDYLSLLTDQTSLALSVSPPPDYASPVERTWNISLDRLQLRSPAAVRMLQLCAFMAPSISLTLIRSREMVEVLRAYDPSLREQLVVGQVLREIGRFALAKVDRKNNQILIHRLVQAVIRDQMSEAEQDEAQHAVHRILAATWPDDPDTDDPGNWARYGVIWPHLEPSKALDCVEEPVRQLLVQRVRYLYRVGSFETALATAVPLEESWRRAIGPGADATSELTPEDAMSRRLQLLSLRYEMANVRRSRGEYDEAHDIDQEVLDEQSSLLGLNNPRTLMTARSLAADLRGQSRYAEALEQDEATYAMFRDELGDEHDGTLMAANNLAISYRLMGDCFKARDIDERTYQTRRQMLGENHPHTLISAGHLARDLREAGEFERSVSQLETTLRSLRELGETLPETLRTAKSLAVSLRRAGHVARARSLTEETYALYVEESEAGTPDAFACLLNHAADLSVHEEKLQAVEETRRVRVEFEAKYGPNHPYTLMCLTNLSMYERGVGRLGEACQLARRAYDGLVATVSIDHPYSSCAALNLANALADLGQLEETLALESRALEGLSGRLSSSHVDALIAESNLSITLRMLGRVEEAQTRHDRVLATIEAKLGAEHPNAIAVRDGRRINRDLEPQPI